MIKRVVAASVWNPSYLTFDGVCNKLLKEGYKQLGEGTFSTVFSNNSQSVLKVSRVDHNMNALRWLEWCKKHPSKYVPKVGHVSRRQSGNERFFICAVERLGKVANWNDVVAISTAMGIQRYLRPKIRELVFFSPFQHEDHDLQQVVDCILQLSNTRVASQGMPPESQDMHPENLYIRGSGSSANLIFVDPLTGGN